MTSMKEITSVRQGMTSKILSFWTTCYSETPKVYVHQYNIGFILISALFLFGIRLLGDVVFQSYLGWPAHSKMSKDAAAAVASIVHAVALCFSIAILLCSGSYNYQPSGKSRSNTTCRICTTALLQFCTGYMLYDALGMVRDNWNTGGLNDSDWIFIAHHVATAFCMNSCEWVGAGHDSVLMLMFLGELSNPLGSLHSITKYAIQLEGSDTFWHIIHPHVEWTFALCYGMIRALIAPLCLVHITFDLLCWKGRQNVPVYLSLVWLFLMWGVIVGSMPWTMETIEMALDGVHVVKYGVDFDYGPRYHSL